MIEAAVRKNMKNGDSSRERNDRKKNKGGGVGRGGGGGVCRGPNSGLTINMASQTQAY